MDLQKKIGPLPVWAWALLAAAGGYFIYRRYSSSSSSSATAPGTTGILDPNAVDPNTGLTYGEEESAALNANAGLAGAGGSLGGGTTDSGAQSAVTPTNEFGDFLNFLGEWNQFAQATGWQPPVTNSGTTTNNGAADVTTPANPPTVAASAHTNPNLTGGAFTHALHTGAGVIGDQARSFLTGLTSAGYHKLAGTTQEGGLAATGTYVKPGSHTIYYAFSQNGQLHIRQAAAKKPAGGGGKITTGKKKPKKVKA